MKNIVITLALASALVASACTDNTPSVQIRCWTSRLATSRSSVRTPSPSVTAPTMQLANPGHRRLGELASRRVRMRRNLTYRL
jgi:hypothetical protein